MIVTRHGPGTECCAYGIDDGRPTSTPVKSGACWSCECLTSSYSCKYAPYGRAGCGYEVGVCDATRTMNLRVIATFNEHHNGGNKLRRNRSWARLVEAPRHRQRGRRRPFGASCRGVVSGLVVPAWETAKQRSLAFYRSRGKILTVWLGSCSSSC